MPSASSGSAAPDASSPAPAGVVDFPSLRKAIDAVGRKLVVLDDDPTGTQTVHGLEVLTEWAVPSLVAALRHSRTAFFILTNTRARPPEQAGRINREIVANLRAAAAQTSQDFTIASRSDSTLRGHFEAELSALRDALGHAVDGVLVIPAFFEGHRVTSGNVHYIADSGRRVPVAETEFARDASFGFSHSDLRLWIQEKTNGRTRAEDVVSVSLATIRSGGANAVCAALLQLTNARHAIVNAEHYGDLEVFVRGLLEAERAGRRFLFRTAASFVRLRAGVTPRPLLRGDEIATPGQAGLIVVGSYVDKSTQQLELAATAPGVISIEVNVENFGAEAARRQEVARVAATADQAMANGGHALIYTSRKLHTALGAAGDLAVAQIVSEGLVEIVRALCVRPGFVIAKGGITSSDLAVKGFGVRRATILGQASPGVPVWRFGAESTHPGLGYVVFPGNVGAPDTLRQLILKLASGE